MGKKKNSKCINNAVKTQDTSSKLQGDDLTFDAIIEAAQAENERELKGTDLVIASFNNITRIISETDKLARENKGTRVLTKDVPSMQQLLAGLLARANRENDFAVLDPNQVLALRHVFKMFPGNIKVDWRKGTNEPYLRLMTRAEKRLALDFESQVLNSSADMRVQQLLNSKRSGKKIEETDKVPDGISTDINSFVLRLTANAKFEKPFERHYYITPDDDPTFKMVRAEDGEYFGSLVVDNQAEWTVDRWKLEAKKDRATLLNILTMCQDFSDELRKLISVKFEGGRATLLELMENSLTAIAEVAGENRLLLQKKKEASIYMDRKAKDEAYILEFIHKSQSYFPILREEFQRALDNSSDGRYHKDRLALVLKGVCDLSKDRGEVAKLIEPLQQEIIKRDRKLNTEAAALKQSQEGRDEDRAKHWKELQKKDSEIMALRQKFSKDCNEAERAKKELHRTIEKLMAERDEKNRRLSVTVQENSVLTSDFEALLSDRDELKTKLDDSQEELNALRKERENDTPNPLLQNTNRQIEQDRVKKAVENATRPILERLKRLEDQNKSLEKGKKADESNIRSLSQDKISLKKSVEKLEEKLSAISEVEEKLEKDLELERAKNKSATQD